MSDKSRSETAMPSSLQKRAREYILTKGLAQGRTIGNVGKLIQPERSTLRQRALYPDERDNDSGLALNRARTQGVLRGIQEVGEYRTVSAPIIRAIGRQQLTQNALQNRDGEPLRMGALGSKTTIPSFLTKRVEDVLSRRHISDLTKTGLGALSKRKGIGRKSAKAKGGRKKTRKGGRKKTRKGGRKKTKKKGGLNLSGCGEGKIRTRYGCGILWNANPIKNPLGCCRKEVAMSSFFGGRKKKTKKKKFRKGSKSKTHRGKNFETRKTSKNYNSKRWKRMTGRRTRKAPLFPFA